MARCFTGISFLFHFARNHKQEVCTQTRPIDRAIRSTESQQKTAIFVTSLSVLSSQHTQLNGLAEECEPMFDDLKVDFVCNVKWMCMPTRKFHSLKCEIVCSNRVNKTKRESITKRTRERKRNTVKHVCAIAGVCNAHAVSLLLWCVRARERERAKRAVNCELCTIVFPLRLLLYVGAVAVAVVAVCRLPLFRNKLLVVSCSHHRVCTRSVSVSLRLAVVRRPIPLHSPIHIHSVRLVEIYLWDTHRTMCTTLPVHTWVCVCVCVYFANVCMLMKWQCIAFDSAVWYVVVIFFSFISLLLSSLCCYLAAVGPIQQVRTIIAKFQQSFELKKNTQWEKIKLCAVNVWIAIKKEVKMK